MNKVIIVDASESDRRLMSGLLVKHGYEPIAVESMGAQTSARRGRGNGDEIRPRHSARVSKLAKARGI